MTLVEPRTPYLILISNYLGDATFAESAALTSNLKLIHCRTLSLGIAAIASSEEIGAILIDAKSDAEFLQFQDALMNNGRIALEKVRPHKMHYLSDLSLNDFYFLSRSPFFGSLIKREHTNDPKRMGEFFGKVIAAIYRRGPLQLKSFLNRNPKIQGITLSNSLEQKNIGTEVLKVGALLGSSPRMAAKAALAAEETLMNAIFNAPVDGEGKRIHQKLSRNTKFTLTGQNLVEFEIGFDSLRMGMRITDHYGSLPRSTLLKHIIGTTNSAEGILDEESAGAGLGLAASYQTSASLFFKCEPGVRTDVFLFFPKAANVRELKSQFRFFTSDFHSTLSQSPARVGY